MESANQLIAAADPSPLLVALRASDARTPESLALFDQFLARSEVMADFFEWSMHIADEVCPHRLTYYFDTFRQGAQDSVTARKVGEQFLALARTLQTNIPADMARVFLDEVPKNDSVLQIVVGIDERSSTNRRLKYYLVFRDEPSEIVRQVLTAAGIATPSGQLDLRRTYILGLDFRNDGVDDVKLYFRLDMRQLARVVENIDDFQPLVRLSRDVVFQHCLLQQNRRQIYLHATHDAVIMPWLNTEARNRPAFSQLIERVTRMNRALAPIRIAPWIISFPYRNRRMDRANSNVYFHLAHG